MISRDLHAAGARQADLVIIGGGILGVCHAFEAARRQLKVLLLERDDFGGGASWASQRIVHGGLRYIQSCDVARHLESVRERRWFLRCFPAFVHPLPCVMPLYDRGLRRMTTMRAALWLNDVLSLRRNHGLPEPQRIPAGRMLSVADTRRWFPQVNTAGLRGAALWHDGILLTPQRVLIEVLRWACRGGAEALNYVSVTAVARESATAYAVHAVDRLSGRSVVFRTASVIDTAGASTGELSGTADHPFVRRPMTVAFGVVLDQPAPSAAAVAVSLPEREGATYFLAPLKGRLLAGTCHLPPAVAAGAEPTPDQVDRFLADLDRCVPQLHVTSTRVLRTLSGILAADDSARPARRPVRHLHSSSRPGSQFVSVWGVKYTTARAVAAGTMQLLAPKRTPRTIPQPQPVNGLDWSTWSSPCAATLPRVRDALRRVQREESVMCINDLLYRRTDWGVLPDIAAGIKDEVAALLSA